MSLEGFPANCIRAVFSDLDDTLTDDGKIHPQTYDCLWRLKEQGFWTVIVSGRPAGWADTLMRLWPIDHMIFENGAGIAERDGKKVRLRFIAPPQIRAQKREQLTRVFTELKAAFPDIKTATDQFCRLHDQTIDYHEEPPFLDDSSVELIMDRLARVPGLTAKLSSIHINFWFGSYTKVTACEKLLAAEGAGRNVERDSVAFVGDSPNDEPLFEFFPNAVGVANIAGFLGRMKHKPRFITSARGGHGFQQIANALLSTRP